MNEIIVGVDDSATAREAAHQAAALASASNLPLHLVMALGKSSAIEVRGGSEKWHTDTVTLAEQVLEALAGERRGSTHQ